MAEQAATVNATKTNGATTDTKVADATTQDVRIMAALEGNAQAMAELNRLRDELKKSHPGFWAKAGYAGVGVAVGAVVSGVTTWYLTKP